MIVRPILLVQKLSYPQFTDFMNILCVGHIGFQWAVRTWAWKTPCIAQHMRSLFLSLVVAILLVSECLRVNFRPFFCYFRVYDTLFSNEHVSQNVLLGFFRKLNEYLLLFGRIRGFFCNPVCTCDLLCRKNLCPQWRSIKQLLFPVKENCIMYPIFVRQNKPSNDRIRIP